MSTNWLYRLSWKEVETYLETDSRIIIPVGSTEQHGKFAPLGTDTLAAVAVAQDASRRTGVLVAPPLWFGWSPHHLVNPGTISIRAEILLELLYDMLDSLARHGFTNFVVVNGHRIVNIAWMQIAAERAQRRLKVRVALFDLAYMSREISSRLGFGAIGHAEEIEISHMLHCHPDLVNLKLARDNPHKDQDLYHLDPRDSRDSLCYVPTTVEDLRRVAQETGDTVSGRPRRSSAEKGLRYHQHLVKRLEQILEQMNR